ncbi:hypothetical protein OsI_38367 [Oryza sativa Indica Group]|uniref:Protein kinase domain-containing protein n=1 Tax=Oryza sativa subsp. indica TaxID=39946 RepID=B8BPQ4_ORYSI|nr:hypothetical protein OsI_38367 [Oryza sativa Indica Group]
MASSSSSSSDDLAASTIDLALEEKLAANALGGGNGGAEEEAAAWEIDLSKLSIRSVVAQGYHGTLFRADYGGHDVAVKRNTGEKPPDRACCVVVEFLGGGTLKKYLIEHYRSKLPYGEVVRLALSMARGLSFLHANKIVHRDVKTENMLFLGGGGGGDLKIADFGVARVEARDPREMTGATGTVGYMAPEVLVGKPYNRKCDVYSFGICLWETYCCEMPFTFGLSVAEASAAVAQRGMRPPIPPCCPPAMARVMARCWDADPAARPEMEEVVRMLEALDTSNGGGMVAPGKMKKKKKTTKKKKNEEEKMPGCFCFFGRS